MKKGGRTFALPLILHSMRGKVRQSAAAGWEAPRSVRRRENNIESL